MIRVATFNVENLLTRFDFSGFHNDIRRDRAMTLFDIKDKREYETLEKARTIALTDDTRQQTALAIADTQADIICLQEVESREALDAFEFGYLFRMMGEGYREKVVSRGNDGRGIDVGVMMRQETADGEPIELVRSTSHASVTYADFDLMTPELEALGTHPNERVFKRDCLVLDLAVGGEALTLFIVHFKSMGGWRDGVPGRVHTMPIRMAEARAVRRIVAEHFGGEQHARKQRFAICGDFNDYQTRIVVSGSRHGGYAFRQGETEVSSLDVLVGDGFCVNALDRLPAFERWTLSHQRGLDEHHLCQLDYILLSPRLAETNHSMTPRIIRAGLPYRVAAPEGQIPERYPRVGWDRPKASDHCPVVIELSLI